MPAGGLTWEQQVSAASLPVRGRALPSQGSRSTPQSRHLTGARQLEARERTHDRGRLRSRPVSSGRRRDPPSAGPGQILGKSANAALPAGSTHVRATTGPAAQTPPRSRTPPWGLAAATSRSYCLVTCDPPLPCNTSTERNRMPGLSEYAQPVRLLTQTRIADAAGTARLAMAQHSADRPRVSRRARRSGSAVA